MGCARRAYLANVSYFDSKIGEIEQILYEINELGSTRFIVTADQDGMLGKRGLWYKMNFFKYSARVPLVMAGPGIVTDEAEKVCSLVDLLPTFLDITGASIDLLCEPIDRHSLMPLAKGERDSVDEALGKCAEMASYPVIMIRREN